MSCNLSPGPSFIKGLLAAQRAAKAVAKSSQNTHHRFSYASAEDMIEAGREWLNQGGLVFWLGSQRIDYQEGRVDLVLELFVAHAESGEGHHFEQRYPVVEGKARPLDKAVLGCQSEALAYALRSVLLIKRGESLLDISGRDDAGYDPQASQGLRPPARQAPHRPAAEPPPASKARLTDEQGKAIGAALGEIADAIGADPRTLKAQLKASLGITSLHQLAADNGKLYTSSVRRLGLIRAAAQRCDLAAKLEQAGHPNVWEAPQEWLLERARAPKGGAA